MKAFTFKSRTVKRLSAVLAVAAAVVTIPAALLAWGPDRPTYTIEHPADHVTFDSITNNPNIGDERNFVGIREVGSSNVWYDNMTVKPGKEYYVRLYVHNNAATSLNASGKGIAHDVTAKVNLPTTTAKSIQVDGEIDASNASPKAVWDQAVFNGSQDFNLAYVKGSLLYENNKGDFSLPESIFTTTGAKLGYGKMDGTLPGCFQYSGYVTFKVKPQFAKTANFTMSKLVSKHGANKWVDNYAAKSGETVDYLIQYKNTGEVQQDNVTVRDKLPAGMTYVNGSSVLGNSKTPSGAKISDNVTKGGVNIGSYAPGANAWVIFSAKAPTTDKLVCGTNKLDNVATVETDYGSKSDNADVTVNKECQQPPVYTCDGLTVTKLSRTSFKFSTAYTVKNATFKNVTYVVRDSNGKEIYRGQDATYTQTKVGKYSVQAYLTVTVKGQDKTVTDNKCKQPFEVKKPEENVIKVCELKTHRIVTIKESDFDKSLYSKDLSDCKEQPVVPSMPSELPTTGPADVIAKLSGLVSLTSATAYYVASRRQD